MANASDSTTQSPTSDTLYSKSTDSFDKVQFFIFLIFSGWRLKKDFDFNEDNLLDKFLTCKGFYGSVYKCLHLVDRRMYAIKIISFEESDKSMREAQVMAMMNHHNVIRYHTDSKQNTVTI
ncbi:hypothetical protein ACJIZ3_021383 [Penstemon smallii]|uniref:Protein kinase domain-containing protein n=1 Tax=Penstemon smallii TaxID=265156 RepID=A0ABD3SL82_9LAMI